MLNVRTQTTSVKCNGRHFQNHTLTQLGKYEFGYFVGNIPTNKHYEVFFCRPSFVAFSDVQALALLLALHENRLLQFFIMIHPPLFGWLGHLSFEVH